MKILYCTDLDGTLLMPDKSISLNSVELLNRLLDAGMLFTVATARSAATAVELLQPLHLTLPGVLLNGALLYDFQKGCYAGCAAIEVEAAHEVLQVLRAHQRPCFLYHLEENEICVQFEQLANEEERRFYQERKGKSYKRFEQVERLTPRTDSPIVYFTMMDTRQRLEPIAEELKAVKGVRAAFYKDNYSEIYYLEIFSSRASKAAGMQHVARMCGAQRTVAFGDNLNDLEMLRAADLGLVVADGRTEALAQADEVIGNSFENGVARYLESHWQAE